jgi:PWWP domain
MDESTNAEYVDQYGEPRVLVQTGAMTPDKAEETAVEPDVADKVKAVDSKGNAAEESSGLVDEVLDPRDEVVEDEEKADRDVKIKTSVKESSGSKGEQKVRSPKKRSHADEEAEGPIQKSKGTPEGRSKGEASSSIKLGDLVWGRLPNSCYYPAVVTMDHFKFFTKIVKAEPGFVSRDPETGLERQSSSDKPAAKKQYHVQFLADNRRHWLSEEFVIAYKGTSHYHHPII